MAKDQRIRSNASRKGFRLLPAPIERIVITILLLTFQPGCESHLSAPEKQRIARAYADALFLEAKYPNDSIRQRHAVDSAVTAYGFKDWQDLKVVVDQSTQEPDDFRMILDSTQRLLERRQKSSTKQTYRQPKDTSDKTATPAR